LRKVVFDSSFLIAVLEKPTTWYEDVLEKVGRFQPVILDCVKKELTRLSDGETKRSRYARLALELTKEFELGQCAGGLSVDDEITSYSKGASALVATVDGRLLSSLRKMRVGAITLNSGRVALA
jgi:rRNA-processing protein FCF1